LAHVKKTLGKKLDLLGMDACLMSNLEVAYQARPYVNYIVASEESEPNEGWPYTAVLGKLVDTPTLSPDDLASHIVAAYIKSYVDMKYKGPVTQSAFDLSKIGMVTDPLDKLANALVAHMPKAAREIWSAQRNSARFWHNTLWDIGHFCEELGKQTANKAVRDAAKSSTSALQSGSGQFVLAESHRGASVDRCAGATIYLLPPLMEVSAYYSDLKYAKEHRWLAMLKAYHAAE
jgi:Clostripain family